MALTKAKLEELIAGGDISIGAGPHSHGNITSDGKVGTTADLTLMTGANGLVTAKTMAEAISIWKFTNPNILHNWDFRNPVNQRAVTGEISTAGYFYDRWIRNSGTVTVGAGYLTLASGAVVEQRIEGNLLAGLVCTVSFEVGGTIYHGSGAFPTNNGTATVEVDGYPDITLGCATGYMFVLIPATSETSIKRFKCEMGFVSTLAYDLPMDYGVELPKCQRFYVYAGSSTAGAFGMTRSATSSRLLYPLPIPMRITPTLAYIYANLFRSDATHTTITDLVVSSLKGNQVIMTATTGGTHTYYRPCVAEFTGLEFFADL